MAYNNQTFTSGQPITANMIDYIDDAVDRLDEVVENLMLAVYPVGSIYLSANNVNPATFFGGTWTLVGTKLAVRENVFGNGLGLSVSDGSMQRTLCAGGQYENFRPNGVGKSIGSRLNNGGLDVYVSWGVLTKEMCGANPQNSGLIVDTETIYSWKRTA